MFSVVIPLYNKEKYIKRTLQSVLDQSVQDFEVVVIDDGSFDNGPELVRSSTDRRLRLIRQTNAGVSVARNRGIAESKFDLIAFLDADDAWEPHHLETILRLAENFPQAGAYATAYKLAFPNGRTRSMVCHGLPERNWEGILPNYFKSATYGPPPMHTSATCVRKHVFDTLGTFAEGECLGEDLDMWGRIALHYPLAYSSLPSSRYNWAAENSLVINKAWERELIFARNIRNYKNEAVINRYIHEYIYKINIDMAIQSIRVGNYELAHRLVNENKTTVNRKKLALLKLALYIPKCILQVIIKVKRLIKTI